MEIHTVTRLSMYTDAKGGGLQDVAYIQLENMTLVDNKDLARLRQRASVLDDEPIPQHIMEVLELCAHALRKTNTAKAKDAMEAIKTLLKAAGTT